MHAVRGGGLKEKEEKKSQDKSSQVKYFFLPMRGKRGCHTIPITNKQTKKQTKTLLFLFTQFQSSQQQTGEIDTRNIAYSITRINLMYIVNTIFDVGIFILSQRQRPRYSRYESSHNTIHKTMSIRTQDNVQRVTR